MKVNTELQYLISKTKNFDKDTLKIRDQISMSSNKISIIEGNLVYGLALLNLC